LDRLAPLLRAEPDNLPLHRECVELAMRGGEFERALALVDARLNRHPSEAETLFARSNALIGLKQHAEALAILKTLEQQGVAEPGVLQNLATCHYILRQFENSRAYAEQLMAAGDRSAGALHLAISSLHHLGEVEAAARLADEHAAVVETHGLLAGVCAMAYLDVEATPKAAKLAAIALAQNPDSIDGLTVQATLAAAALETEQAFSQFTRITQLAPQSGRAWLGLGLLATLAQDFARAKELLTRATELMPNHLGSWHSLAWAHLFSGDSAGAERLFAHALELDRTFGESHGAMAAMLAMRGDREGAEREIEIAERLDRKGASAQFARAMLLAHTSGPEASRQFIRDSVVLLARQFLDKPRAVLTELAKRTPKRPPPG
jgi:tetratricopeptide (TPR) repeat protein